VATQLSLVFFMGLLGLVWMRGYKSFPVLARQFLCIAPFLPVVSVLDHNLDHDSSSSAAKVAPIYVALLLLFLCLLIWRARGATIRIGGAEVFLAMYILFSAAQIPASADPVWSLCAWSWSVPGYLLFLMAGRATSETQIAADRLPAWTMLGFCAISVGFIAIGVIQGRAATIFYTRNFGSIYASTALLAFLALFIGPAWVAIRRSAMWSFIIFLVSAMGMLFSISRTAASVVPVYLLVLSAGSRKQLRRATLAVAMVVVSLGLGVWYAGEQLHVDAVFFGDWVSRFENFTVARDSREAKFSGFRESMFRDVPWHGQGMGTFLHYSNYGDAHNILVTEGFENSAVAALFLLLAFSPLKCIRALFDRELRPFAASILGFLFIGHTTGAMLSYRSEGYYYSAFPGWTLFYLIGYVLGRLRERSQTCIEGVPGWEASVALANPSSASAS